VLSERWGCRLLVRLAIALWLTAALAAVWEGLAQQAPDSPFRLGLLAGPISQLRAHAFGLGTGLCAGAWIWPWLYPPGRGRVALIALTAGSVLSTLALAYAAREGMVGIQLIDPRVDARRVVWVRGAGHALLILALCDAMLRAFVAKLRESR
jgi:hypothetical protein